MKSKQELQAELGQFHGSDVVMRYSPLYPRMYLTEGVMHLAVEAQAFWLMDAISSHMMSIPDEQWMVIVRLVVKGHRAVLTLADDEPASVTYARQEIDFTDFPLDEITLYIGRDPSGWVLMLPGEY